MYDIYVSQIDFKNICNYGFKKKIFPKNDSVNMDKTTDGFELVICGSDT